VAVERSRSDNGAHVWLFFSSAVRLTAAIGSPPFLDRQSKCRRYRRIGLGRPAQHRSIMAANSRRR
jgi:hypothetical protein